jgi:hypothetical protein
MALTQRPWRRGEDPGTILGTGPARNPVEEEAGGPIVAEGVGEDDTDLILAAVRHLEREGQLIYSATELTQAIWRLGIPSAEMAALLLDLENRIQKTLNARAIASAIVEEGAQAPSKSPA